MATSTPMPFPCSGWRSACFWCGESGISRAEALRTLLAFTLAVGGGWTGACVGILLLLFLSRLPLDLLNSPWGSRVALGLLAGLLLLLTGLQFRGFLPARIARYSGNPGVSFGGVTYPDAGLSVRETQDVSPAAALQGAAFAWVAGSCRAARLWPTDCQAAACIASRPAVVHGNSLREAWRAVCDVCGSGVVSGCAGPCRLVACRAQGPEGSKGDFLERPFCWFVGSCGAYHSAGIRKNADRSSPDTGPRCGAANLALGCRVRRTCLDMVGLRLRNAVLLGLADIRGREPQ